MEFNHYIVYTSPNGLVALAAMQRPYIDLVTLWLNNPEATAGIILSPPVTLESEIAWYERIHKESNIIFAILARKDTSEQFKYAGHTALNRITWPDARASTGTFIGDPEARGRGVGKEAKMLLLNHAFRMVGLRKITSEVKAFNLASVGHLVACGYGVVGCRKEQHFHNGGFVDEILLEVHRRDFEPLWEQYQQTKEVPKLTDEQKAEIQKLFPE